MKETCGFSNGGRHGALAHAQLQLLEVWRDLAACQVAARHHVLCNASFLDYDLPNRTHWGGLAYDLVLQYHILKLVEARIFHLG